MKYFLSFLFLRLSLFSNTDESKLFIITRIPRSLISHVKHLLKKLPCLLRRSMIGLSMRFEVSV